MISYKSPTYGYGKTYLRFKFFVFLFFLVLFSVGSFSFATVLSVQLEEVTPSMNQPSMAYTQQNSSQPTDTIR